MAEYEVKRHTELQVNGDTITFDSTKALAYLKSMKPAWCAYGSSGLGGTRRLVVVCHPTHQLNFIILLEKMYIGQLAHFYGRKS